MTKYIVKNCPCLEEHTQNCWNSHIPNEISCKDRTDCPIKRGAKICQEKWNKFYDPLAKVILQTLQVEEVE